LRSNRPNLLGWAIALWIAGLVTIVPYGTYYLLLHAARDEYAFLITLVLFWIFGYWGVVGPLLAALKVRAVFRAIEQAHIQGKLAEALSIKQTRELAIDLIAYENGIPRFLAAWVYRVVAAKLHSRVDP
jgi:hypothetical protein